MREKSGRNAVENAVENAGKNAGENAGKNAGEKAGDMREKSGRNAGENAGGFYDTTLLYQPHQSSQNHLQPKSPTEKLHHNQNPRQPAS